MPRAEVNLFPDLLALVDRHWGFTELRPLQEQAMRAALMRRDSLVVLPTGAGKSLCLQAPALVRAREITVVVSPLIALMKDQVDGLRAADAVHLATAVAMGAKRFITNNRRDFGPGIAEVDVTYPDDLPEAALWE